MPLLGALLVNLVSGLASFIAHFLTKKIAFGLAAVASLSVIAVALFVTMNTVVTGIIITVTEPMFLLGLSMAVPSNAPACLTAIATVWAACTLYSWQSKALDLFAKVS